MAETKRAQCVCHACNVRKKACDKALPACGFCAKRNLSCRYDITAQRRKGRRAYNPGKHFVAIDTWSSSDDASRADPAKGPSALRRSPSAIRPSTSHKSLHEQVLDIISISNLAPEDISKHYFQTFHQRCPMISPELFNQKTSQYRRRGQSPPANFSILLLAMHLATMLQNLHPSHLSGSSQEQLYANTKSLFAQAQATTCTSLSLVQAILIIATCEYAFLRSEAAYISISTCSGLARLLGVDKEILNRSEIERENGGTDLMETERVNVAWTILMMERIILAELDQRDSLPLSEYPGPASRLPSDLHLAQHANCEISSSATLSRLQATNVSWFGRQAQAVFLLDRVLRISRAASHRTQNLLSEVAEVDGEIHNFLKVVMDEVRRKNILLCTPVALCIRTIFLLHLTMLDALSNPQTKDEHQARRFSQAALDSACQMIVDTVRHTDRKPSDSIPVCCYYNLHAAIQYLSKQKQHAKDDAASASLDYLLYAHTALRSA